MSRGNWRSNIAVGIGVVGGLLVALWFSPVVTLGPTPGEGKGVGETNGRKRKQTNASPAPSIDKPQEQPPSAGDQAYCKDSQSRPDCHIQLRTARATERQAEIAWLTYITVAVTLAFTLGTVVAGFLTVGVMRRTAERQLRAYVFINPKGLDFGPSIINAFVFELQNSGSTPAKNMRMNIDTDVLPYPPPINVIELLALSANKDESGHSLGGQSSMPLPVPLGRPPTEEQTSQLQAGEHLYVLVTIGYKDIFNRDHSTRLCMSCPGPNLIHALERSAAGHEGIASLKQQHFWRLHEQYCHSD
jgi:hypothetical protein